MITACHSCKFNGIGRLMEQIIQDKTANAELLAAKKAILEYVSNVCGKCRRVSQDDIRIERSPKNERPELTVDRAIKRKQPEQCTGLPEDIEQTLKNLAYTIRDLDPLDVLLLIHVAKGGAAGTFGRYVQKVFDDAKLYGDTIGRATAKAKWAALCRKIAPFAVLRTWAKGHGGRIAKEPNEDEPNITQAELDI